MIYMTVHPDSVVVVVSALDTPKMLPDIARECIRIAAKHYYEKLSVRQARYTCQQPPAHTRGIPLVPAANMHV